MFTPKIKWVTTHTKRDRSSLSPDDRGTCLLEVGLGAEVIAEEWREKLTALGVVLVDPIKVFVGDDAQVEQLPAVRSDR